MIVSDDVSSWTGHGPLDVGKFARLISLSSQVMVPLYHVEHCY
jgi:hypothetical protein